MTKKLWCYANMDEGGSHSRDCQGTVAWRDDCDILGRPTEHAYCEHHWQFQAVVVAHRLESIRHHKELLESTAPTTAHQIHVGWGYNDPDGDPWANHKRLGTERREMDMWT